MVTSTQWQAGDVPLQEKFHIKSEEIHYGFNKRSIWDLIN